ncbi:MAG: coenzyme F420 hydrogenase/dehydrogenase beta subunit N-terminal domain-containing protein [Magnetospiraceae bacterium]
MTAASPPSVEDIARRGHCSGCGLCQSVSGGAIQVSLNDTGYMRPATTAPAEASALRTILSVCPGVSVTTPASETPIDPLWGPIESLMIGHATDPQIRFTGSSGGVITATATYLLTSGAVDAVVTNRVNPEDPLGNQSFVATTAEELLEAAGSRYAPSAPLRDIVQIAQTYERICFVGKPCDIAALRAYTAVNPLIAERIQYYLGFFCAGIPSRKGGRRRGHPTGHGRGPGDRVPIPRQWLARAHRRQNR